MFQNTFSKFATTLRWSVQLRCGSLKVVAAVADGAAVAIAAVVAVAVVPTVAAVVAEVAAVAAVYPRVVLQQQQQATVVCS